MRLWLDGTPGLDDPPEELAEKAWRALTARPGGVYTVENLQVGRLPIYTSSGLSVRFRFVHELPQLNVELAQAAPPGGLALPSTPAISTLAWFWVHVLEGLLWRDGGQVAELHVRREWGRVAGVEVTV